MYSYFCSIGVRKHLMADRADSPQQGPCCNLSQAAKPCWISPDYGRKARAGPMPNAAGVSPASQSIFDFLLVFVKRVVPQGQNTTVNPRGFIMCCHTDWGRF